MGASVSNFAKEAAKDALKWVAKKGISWVGAKIPIIGTPIADAINRTFKKGGVCKAYADGGVVEKLKEEGIKTQVVNTPAQLIAAIKKFPEAAQKAGLTVEMVKDAKDQKVGNAMSKPVEETAVQDAPMMKRGGRKAGLHGHVEEIASHDEEPVKQRRKKASKRRHREPSPADLMAHGGVRHASVASLPYSNLDRLNNYARGGQHLDVGLQSGNESYVQLHHGKRHGLHGKH
jgi:hypothetical protein